ncbi:tetratricopeptide repeat protein [Candidatus Omnitrophota bacterium]
MKKSPSVKVLLFAILFSFITIFSRSDISWAYLIQQAEEYRFKAEQAQEQGQLKQAIQFYKKAIGIDSANAAAYNGLAICYEKTGQFEQAEQQYLQAIEANQKYAPAHYNLGLFYQRQGRFDKAVYYWKQRLRLGAPTDPGRIKARLKLKQFAPDELEEEEAKDLSRKLAQDKETQAFDQILGTRRYKTKEELIQDYYIEGMQFYRAGDFQKTSEYFQKMIDTLPFTE